MPNKQEVADFVLELLAEQLQTDVEQLREELAAGGPEMPIDSYLLVEVMARVEKRFGVRVPESTTAAAAFSSVASFVQMIASLAATPSPTTGG